VSKKSWGESVVGWFVEQDEPEEKKPAKKKSVAETLAAIEEEEAARPAPPPNAVALEGEVPEPPEPGGGLDFTAVYKAAGITDETQDHVEKAINLLDTLPSDATDEVKRQIVEASLKAFGYPVDQIIEAGAREIQALQAFIELGQRKTHTLVAESNARIEALKQEMAQIEEQVEAKLAAQTRLANQCNQQKLRVQGVLEFFGQETVEKVVSPPSPPQKAE
jgi:hypothetical protein